MRPSWAELMEMDMPMAVAVVMNLPPLQDGTGDYLKALIASLTGRR